MDWTQVTTLSNHPENSAGLALIALQRTCQLNRPSTLGRSLTRLERLALATASTQPTHHLTLGTRDMSQPELARAFGLFVRKVERRKHQSGPLIYFGGYGNSKGNGGYHMHLLLWEKEPFYKSYMKQARSVGISNCYVDPIGPRTQDKLCVAQYVFSQQESVFGSHKHSDNEPREKFKRAFISNHAVTLREYHPELFRATELAKDRSVSDEKLFVELPLFINNMSRGEI